MALNSKEIEKSIYGQDGLYDRVIAEIRKITPRKVSEITGKSTQHIYVFMDRNHGKPKLDTIIYFGRSLGVE